MRDADDAHPRIATRVAVRGQLLEVGTVSDGGTGRIVCAEPGLLDELTRCRRSEVLIGSDESSR